MGAGYIAGAYFFVRVFASTSASRRSAWRRVLLTRDRFIQDNVAFWIWMGLYVTTPILVPLAWWTNRKTDPGTLEQGESRLPSRVRNLLIGADALQVLVALVLLLSPSTMIDAWPWMLTPLTAQTLSG